MTVPFFPINYGGLKKPATGAGSITGGYPNTNSLAALYKLLASSGSGSGSQPSSTSQNWRLQTPAAQTFTNEMGRRQNEVNHYYQQYMPSAQAPQIPAWLGPHGFEGGQTPSGPSIDTIENTLRGTLPGMPAYQAAQQQSNANIDALMKQSGAYTMGPLAGFKMSEVPSDVAQAWVSYNKNHPALLNGKQTSDPVALQPILNWAKSHSKG